MTVTYEKASPVQLKTHSSRAPLPRNPSHHDEGWGVEVPGWGVSWLRECGEGAAPRGGCPALPLPPAAGDSAHMEYSKVSSFCTISHVLEFYGNP